MSQKLVCDACNRHIEPYQQHYRMSIPDIEFIPERCQEVIRLPQIEGDYCSARCLHMVVTKAIDSTE
jgi:hypothetical protein